MSAKPLTLLKKYWGHDSFRPHQREIVEDVISGKDVLAVLPTGGGKSICFQLPALTKAGLCVVVSPLIALMKDQVANLNKRDIPAMAVYSGMNQREIDIALDNCIYGGFRFLYVSPERLLTELFKERVKRMNVNLLAVDEAHCISQWGHDFRPSYLKISELRDLLPEIGLIALTATATTRVKEEIVEKLMLRSVAIHQGSFRRPNLSYSIRKAEDKESKLLEIIKSVPGSAIVYARTRKETKELSSRIKAQGISSSFYHAGLDPAVRSSRQEGWTMGKIRVIVATNAFGMGIDKPDVRLVIHYEMSTDMESYYQEAGRAGRDGEKAYAVVVFHPADVDEIEKTFSKSNPDIKYLRHVYQCLANYYKLAVGSQHFGGYDFVLYDFASQYNLDHLEAFYALRKLEEEGLLQLHDSLSDRSTLHIPVSHNDLYKFQVANAYYDGLIKALLRTHGGELFSQFTPISETKISRILRKPESKVYEDLWKLHRLNVVAFSPRKDKPYLVFLSARYDAAKLPLDRQGINQRKKNDREKLDFMIDYVREEKLCRTNMIQEYFGEITDEKCGICDNCVSRKRAIAKPQYGLETVILNSLEVPLFPDELISRLEASKNDIMNAVAMLSDSGHILYDKKGRIRRR